MTENTTPNGAGGAPDGAPRGHRREQRSVAVAGLGTIIEWYDFSLYLYLAPALSRVFFGGDAASSLVLTFGIFAAAYIARPVGAVVFGSLGDRRGRREALIFTAAIMAVALLLTALLPGWESIGLAAPILLLAFRVLMSFAVGGEYSGILVFLLESARPGRRGLISSLAPATSGLGALLAVGVSTLVVATLSTAQLDSWGWRLPFLLGAVMSAAFLLLRTTIDETPSFRHARDAGRLDDHPVRTAFRNARRGLLAAFSLSAVGSASYYLGVSYVPTFLETEGGVEAADGLLWSTAAAVLLLVVTPLAGLAADRFGRKPSLVVVAVILAVTAVPGFAVLASGVPAGAIFAAVVLAVGAGSWSAVAASAIPEQFPTEERFSGIAVGYNFATAIFGGLVPLAATLLIAATGVSVAPAFVLATLSLLIIPLILWLPETAERAVGEAPAEPAAGRGEATAPAQGRGRSGP